MEIQVEIITERTAALRFDQFPTEAHDRFRATVTTWTDELESRVQASEPYLTGKLRAETQTRIVDYPDRITGSVRITSEFAKAAALEYGAHSVTTVKAHMAKLDHLWGKLVDPMTVMVAAHSRHLNIAEHRFLRGSLASISGPFLDAMKRALDEATEAAS